MYTTMLPTFGCRRALLTAFALFPFSFSNTIGQPVGAAETLAGQATAGGFIRKISRGTPQRVVLYGTSLTAKGAWVGQLQQAVEAAYPKMVTWINSGGSGKASDWGVANLQNKVINQDPDTVLIEFSMNDAAMTLNITRAQALDNLTMMVKRIKSAHPACEIILQIMNPVDRRERDPYSPRPGLALYQQDCRDFASSNGLPCIDHMPAFVALLDEGSDAYRQFVPDGVHPSAEGFARYLTPTLVHALGIGLNQPLPTVRLRMHHARAAEPAVAAGASRASSLIVWRSGSTQAVLEVPLDFSGGSAISGVDYSALPASITIPAGKSSAALDLMPLHDLLTEGDETFKVALGQAAGFSAGHPNKAGIVIEDRDTP